MDGSYPQYITKAAVDSLIIKLNLPSMDPNTQDWDYEYADSSKVSEFISSYETFVLTTDEKFALMKLIIASYDEAIEKGDSRDGIWDKIKYYLIKEINVHKNTILYWAQEDEELEDSFAITPLMREIVKLCTQE